MAVRPLLDDASAAPEAQAVFDEIRAARGTDYVNNFWRAPSPPTRPCCARPGSGCAR